MRSDYFKTTSLIIGAMFLLTEGCAHKELNNDAPTTIAENVEIVFDWSKVSSPQASTMELYLYSDSHEVMTYSFNNRDGGLIRSYGGKHTAVCHSNDDPYALHVRNHHAHDEVEIYTDNTSTLVGQGISTRGLPRAPGTEQEPLRATPSMLYGTHHLNLNLKVSALSQTVTLYPEELVCHYSVEFIDVENLQNADLRIDACISSLAGGYKPGRMEATDEAVSHTFTLTADNDMKSLHSQFLTFGVPPGEELPHMVCLYVALKNKTGNFYTFDVSDQVNQAPDPRNVNIKIYGLKLPELPDDPPDNPPVEGGVSVEVDSWNTIHYDLKV
ncbi:MAG: DUF5119 domain-containing protein [Muribaculaceae bacterium]|nr:DUF5119 domain-containing protein [Muribaculaceae bacterium]